jgi:hypothetical protein
MAQIGLEKKSKQIVESELEKHLLGGDPSKLLRKNLDGLNLPSQIDLIYPEKVAVYEQMRSVEQKISEFVSRKLTSIKEDLLATS